LRFLQLLGLLAIMAGCRQSPSPPAPAPAIIERAPVPSARGESFRCDYDPDPMLAITSTQVLLDSVAVDEAKLKGALNNTQALYAQLGSPPKNNIFVQVTKGVSESRVLRYLATARAAGFSNVTRLADFDSPETRATKSHGAR
jgi:hypothetical protein